MTGGSRSDWTARTGAAGPGVKFRLGEGGSALDFDGFFCRLATDPGFADWLSGLLATPGYDAFFWELPPLTRATLGQPAEFVVTDSPALARQAADAGPFEEWFGRGGDVVTFPNLSGDAILVVPVPRGDRRGYAHLARFLREAPREQVRSLWATVAGVFRDAVGQEPRWLSTSGLGVAWLHVRLDTRPKYYQYRPYTRPPSAGNAS